MSDNKIVTYESLNSMANEAEQEWVKVTKDLNEVANKYNDLAKKRSELHFKWAGMNALSSELFGKEVERSAGIKEDVPKK